MRGLLDAGAGRIEKELAGQPEVQAEMLTVMGRVYQRLGVLDKAQAAPRESVGHRAPRARPGGRTRGRDAQRPRSACWTRRETSPPPRPTSRAGARPCGGSCWAASTGTSRSPWWSLGRVYSDQGFDERAEPLLREALAIRRKVLGEGDHETATSESELGLLLWRKGDLAGGRVALPGRPGDRPEDVRARTSPDVASVLNNLALISMEKERLRGSGTAPARVSRNQPQDPGK